MSKKLKIYSNFLWEKCPYPGKVEKCPYPKSEGWKRKQYFLSPSASCQKGLLTAENIMGSSVEINVNELSFFHHKILINTVITFHTKNCFDNG